MEYIKSPIFYMGNKFKLLPKLYPLFPENINTFYDLFGGSGCISGNVSANKIIYNEINPNIVNLYKLFLTYTPDQIQKSIYTYIKKYDLNTEGTDVRQNNPDIKKIREYYNNNYIKFREAYNESERNFLMLYTLTFYSFSNLIRFNSNNNFNMPYGNRCYCKKHYEQIKKWYELIKNKNIEIYNENAFDILCSNIVHNNFKKNDFVYLDPPYTNTTAIYNEKRAFGGWGIKEDTQLFLILENLNKDGIKWGLSNVFENKGIKNEHLIKWCKNNNWKVYHLDYNYYSLGKGNANSDEVYICNYEKNNTVNFGQLSLFN